MPWPVPAPVLPLNVNPGDRITASYTNVQAQAFRDLWTNIQASQTPWQQDVDANGHALTGLGREEIHANGVDYPWVVWNVGATLRDWRIGPAGNMGTETGRSIDTLGSISFMDSSVQTTAYKGVAATQTPWLQDIDANRKTLSQVGQIVIFPIAGVQRFGITNDAGTGWEWLVDSAGNLRSLTGATITTAGDVAARDLQASRNVNSAGGVVGASLIARGGALYVQDATGAVNHATIDNAGNITTAGDLRLANGNLWIYEAGAIFSTGGVEKVAIGASAGGVILGSTQVIKWSQSEPWNDVADVAVRRRSAGVVTLYNPQTARSPNLEFGPDCGLRVITIGSVLGLEVYDASSLNGAPLKCLGLTSTGNVSATNGFLTGGGAGKYGSFTTADGKTITVNGGIIISIV